MKTKLIIAALAMCGPCLALAQDADKYQCSYGELQRRVEIYTEPGVAVPCEVHYYKDTEAPGETQVLWSAGNDASYCASKSAEFVAKLVGWGWNCESGVDAASDAPAEPEAAPDAEEPEEPPVRDDTDVLSPGDPSGA